jgi:integrase/recombinase XerD
MMQRFDEQGRRLYFTDEERRAFLRAAVTAPRETRSFCSTLHYTGCRISEALSESPKRVDLSGKVIIFETLKRSLVFVSAVSKLTRGEHSTWQSSMS